MIINTGQRTDIPAFYSKWFINRIKEGFVMVRNPFVPNIVTKFKLTPDVVDLIGFCTKNPRPLLQYMDLLKPFGQYRSITITAFDKDIEPNVPPIDEVIKDFQYISNIVGKNAIVWRYTPIIINEKYTIERHLKTFDYIAKSVSNFTDTVIYGFIDFYDKLIANHPEIKDCSDEDKITLTKEFIKIAKKYNLTLKLCSKEKWLSEYGVDASGCMKISDYEKAINANLNIDKKSQGRKGYCACYLANDIGAYNSCLHFCSYCYANGSKETILKNYKNHDDNSPLLIGNINENDTIKEAKQSSNKSMQITLF
ncbi:MAG: DUF1848 domain-containing protein [Bacilli bacterium]|nr:DUF1848 domain-containing protein [Bacilli bacterium]